MKVKTKTSKKTVNPAAMKGADVVVRCLENEGVEIVFAYPGGSSHVYPSLSGNGRFYTEPL